MGRSPSERLVFGFAFEGDTAFTQFSELLIHIIDLKVNDGVSHSYLT